MRPSEAGAERRRPLSASVEIRVSTTPQELFEAAAEVVVHTAKNAVEQRGRFTIALSGGSTPKSLFNLLATNARTVLPWDRMFFFWGDERHVPPTDPKATTGWRKKHMLSKIPVAAGNVFRIPAENPDAAAAADPTSRLCGSSSNWDRERFRFSI